MYYTVYLSAYKLQICYKHFNYSLVLGIWNFLLLIADRTNYFISS